MALPHLDAQGLLHRRQGGAAPGRRLPQRHPLAIHYLHLHVEIGVSLEGQRSARKLVKHHGALICN